VRIQGHTHDTQDHVKIDEADGDLVNIDIGKERVFSRQPLSGLPDSMSASNGSLSERGMVREARKRRRFATVTSSKELSKSEKK
jgi:hypothetical protein